MDCTKYTVEVEYDDDGPSMAGAHDGTLRRAEVFTVEAIDVSSVPDEIRKHFKDKMHYSTIRRIGRIGVAV